MATPKRPTDINERAKLIIDIAIGEQCETNPDEGKNSEAVKLGKLGGAARAKSLTSEKRKEIAQNAAKKRWKSE